jgi:hypothetical protein
MHLRRALVAVIDDWKSPKPDCTLRNGYDRPTLDGHSALATQANDRWTERSGHCEDRMKVGVQRTHDFRRGHTQGCLSPSRRSARTGWRVGHAIHPR